MHRRNLFDGDSYKAQFAIVIYRRLLSREWFSYSDVMADFMSKDSSDDLPYSVSKCEGYGELKKSFADVKGCIEGKVGPGCIEEQGNNRNKLFRYTGEDDDPLEDIKNARVINDLRQYWQFCQDSAGFFPKAWLEYFFKNSQDLLDMNLKRSNGEQVIASSIDRKLINIDFLPILYESIVHKQVLEIKYQPFGKEQVELLFHPHYLKEYNGRWFLFGQAEGKEPQFGYNLPLDRIVSKPREIYKNVKYVSAPSKFYTEFFKNIVGVSHHTDCDVKEIIVRAHTLYMFNLIETMPIHTSQQVIKPYADYEDGSYGEFSLRVEVNDEFVGAILQKGNALEIMSPSSVRDLFRDRIKNMLDLY